MKIIFDQKETPKTKEELVKLIKIAMLSKGSDCDLNFIDTSQITDMSELFKDSDFSGDISKWDVSKVTNMEGMFTNCPYGNHSTANWYISDQLRLQIGLSKDLHRPRLIYVTKEPYEYKSKYSTDTYYSYNWTYDPSRINLPKGSDVCRVYLDIYNFDNNHFHRLLNQLVIDSPLPEKFKKEIGDFDMGTVISYISYNQLNRFRNIGKKSIEDVKDYLKNNGILLD